jgi:hypothetical protein
MTTDRRSLSGERDPAFTVRRWRQNPTVDDDPVLVYVASHTQNGMAWGGHLVATWSRIVFTPTPKNVDLGGQAWSARLSDIREVGTKGRT